MRRRPADPGLSRRIRRELETVRAMIGIYCRHHHAPRGPLCQDCQALWEYARRRVERCRFGTDKPTCANCSVHCFKRDRRERIRVVMRYAGPRMLFHHPVLTLFHFLDGRRQTPQGPERDAADD